MSNKILVIPASLFFVVLAGCSIPGSNVGDTYYKVEGYIYEDCSQEPYANRALQIWQDYEAGIFDDYGGVLAEATTDENGFFSCSYKRENYSYCPVIQSDGGYEIMMIPCDTDIYDVVAYIAPTANIQVSLNVINPYEEGDTLVIGDFTTLNNLYIPCPVSSGVLYTAENFPLLTMSYTGQSKYINWFITPYNDNAILHWFTIDKYCNDTVFVTVDIY